jgi:hypothetical protein
MKTSREQSTAANPPAVDQQASSAPGQTTADQIAITAYLKAQARGFEPGHELEDWFAAEAEYHQ